MFINRILTVLRNAPHLGTVYLPSAFFRDIHWSNIFLQIFNGMVEIQNKIQKPQEIFVDASVCEVGVKWNDEIFSCVLPDNFKNGWFCCPF